MSTSGEAQLAAQQLSQFFQNLRHIEALCDRVRELDNIENEIARKKREHDDLFAGMKQLAMQEARRDLEAEEAAHSAKLAQGTEAYKVACEITIQQAESEAAAIIDAARKQAAEMIEAYKIGFTKKVLEA